jgi:cystathionine beta-lyase
MDNVEATYLAWIDARKLDVPNPALFFERAGVGLSDGRHFQGEGYVRLNFGCPRETLLKALDRMKRAVADSAAQI